MALDGIFIYSVAEELRESLVNGRVDKINQPEKDEIIISIKNSYKTFKLLISASAVFPKIHLTNTNKQNPMKAPAFCMVLRKHLNNARLIDIRQLETDRVLLFDFESLDELGFNSIYTLIVEIMGRHSNITLIRQRDNIIMDSIKRVTPDINSFRSLYPGIKHVYPPASKKLNPFNFDLISFKEFITVNNIEYTKSLFSSVFTGVSLQFSKELFYRTFVENISGLEDVYVFINSILHSIKNGNFSFLYYTDASSIKDFYCVPLTSLNQFEEKSCSSASELLEHFYFEKDKADRLNSKSTDLQKIINTNLDRCYKKLDILKKTLEECTEADKYKLYGELITANIYSLKSGDKAAHVLNYYSEDEEYLDIKLDENKTPSENSQYYYKKYNKLKKSYEAANYQIKLTEDEISYLQSVLTSIKNAEEYITIEEIKNELIETGYVKFKKIKGPKNKSSAKPVHVISSDGIDIYIGKNNIQNDYLTLKFADKHDTWLHTKNIPGSHVIIKKYGDVPEKTLLEAAALAAYYSKAKDSSKVAVDYTEVRNVHKPNGAKPGMVIYYTNSTVYVDPEKTELKEL
jgi:predicted ribosome quality control (RQC) complex YloA/Tae2 family protein